LKELSIVIISAVLVGTCIYLVGRIILYGYLSQAIILQAPLVQNMTQGSLLQNSTNLNMIYQNITSVIEPRNKFFIDVYGNSHWYAVFRFSWILSFILGVVGCSWLLWIFGLYLPKKLVIYFLGILPLIVIFDGFLILVDPLNWLIGIIMIIMGGLLLFFYYLLLYKFGIFTRSKFFK
jgi:hypothetical protein